MPATARKYASMRIEANIFEIEFRNPADMEIGPMYIVQFIAALPSKHTTFVTPC